jgi:hypothetical protein
MRWISEVPSKIVKILELQAVYAGQRPVYPRGISTDSARPSEMNVAFRSARVRGELHTALRVTRLVGLTQGRNNTGQSGASPRPA